MRRLSLLIALFLLMMTLSGCYDMREVDDQAYIIAIGLDKGKTNTLFMTLQFAIPKAIGGGGGDSGGGGGDPTTIITLECPTIYAGFNMANNYISRQINLSHAKAIVFSSELAREGIEPLVVALPRGREFRPTINMLVSRGEASEYIKSIKPQIESNPAKYYELLSNSYTYTSFTGNSSFINFYKSAKSIDSQPVATLAGVGDYKAEDEFNPDKSTYALKERQQPLEGDFKAGDLPKKGGIKGEIMGLGIFNGGKLIGELDGEETSYYLMLKDEYKRSYITAKDPKYEDKYIIMDVRRSRGPKKSVKFMDGKPVISVGLELEGDIVVIQSGYNYESIENTKIIEQVYNERIKTGILKFLEKTSKEFGSDIIGFGQLAKKKFLTYNEWQSFKWLDLYKNAQFNVEVDYKIRRPGLTIRSAPIISNTGEGSN